MTGRLLEEQTHEHLKHRMGQLLYDRRVGKEMRHPAVQFSRFGLLVDWEDIWGVTTMARGLIKCLGLSRRGLANVLDFEVVQQNIIFEPINERLMGLKVLHLSDLHIDGLPSGWERLLDLVGEAVYDICLITGDYRFMTYGDIGKTVSRMEKLMKRINCPHGTFGILGNHDCLALVPPLEDMGIRMLLNESKVIEHNGTTFGVAGVDDAVLYQTDSMEKALEGIEECDFKILLAHSQHLIRRAASSGVNFYLCGHTHGGQICLPRGMPVVSGTHYPKKFVSGLWEYRNMVGYTSRGVGCSVMPARFNCRPEITVHKVC